MYPLQLLNSIISLTWLALTTIILILLLSLVPVNEFNGPISDDFSTAVFVEQEEKAERDPKYAMGKALFKSNCAQCHNKNMTDDLTGPALAGTLERWSAYPQEDLYNWVRHSQQLISQNHPRALSLWNSWKPTVMNDFSKLTNEEIAAIFVYVEQGK